MAETTKPVIGDETHAEALRIAERYHLKQGWKFSPEQVAKTAQDIITALTSSGTSPLEKERDR
jgi:hypothetical protein